MGLQAICIYIYIRPWGSDFDPYPQPQNSLLRISVCNQVSTLKWKFLLSEPGRGKIAPTAIFRTFTPSVLRRISFPCWELSSPVYQNQHRTANVGIQTQLDPIFFVKGSLFESARSSLNHKHPTPRALRTLPPSPRIRFWPTPNPGFPC